MRILSGIQPSGKLHIGNYFGMMKPAIELQEQGEAEGVPISERFFVGGINSVRGYDPRSLSPTIDVPDNLSRGRIAVVPAARAFVGLRFAPAWRLDLGITAGVQRHASRSYGGSPAQGHGIGYGAFAGLESGEQQSGVFAAGYSGAVKLGDVSFGADG